MLFGLATTRGATFTVSNANDSGAGSLRQAMLDANTAGGANLIRFQIPGTGPFTITLASALPAVTSPMTIDGATQTGYSNQPLIELNGASAGVEAIGIRLTSSSNVVRGLAINRFATDGIRSESVGNTFQGNHIGIDPSGTIVRANGQYGIFVLGGFSNVIGGASSAARNIIGGNDTGVYLLNSFGNVIQGNYIGASVSGSGDVGNTNNGIAVYNSSDNLIGGPSSAERNIISGNNGSGINLNTAGATGNLIQGNYIGVNASGSASLSNNADGITLNDAAGNRIGGTISGAGNVISGNSQAGIFLNGVNCRNNVLEGNFIGTDASGTAAVANRFAGVTVANASSNTIGGVTIAARNLISGNAQEGIFLSSNSRTNRIFGNYIGTTGSGLTALPNQGSGVSLNNASDNWVGGSNAGEGNLISGNNFLGIWLINANATRNLIRGNLLGVNASGSVALGNAQAGVGISDAPTNQIGGASVLERNIISGNGYPANSGGVFITGSSARGNRFLGNHIGTDSSGSSALPNRFEGVYIINASSNSIGGLLGGEGNLISGNTTRGLRLTNSVATDILGNYFGLRADGTNSLANGQFNIELEERTTYTRIGATNGGGNRIAFSGGGFAGIRVRDLSTNNLIVRNAIFNNSGLAIDIGAAGVNANDDCDSDGGSNQSQNFPVLTQAFGGAAIGIRGTLNSQPNQTYRLQFFASSSCDGSGNGEGELYLGEKIITTGAGCSTNFNVALPIAVPVGRVITATATDAANNTSEFSSCLVSQATPDMQFSTTGGSLAITWAANSGFVLRETTNLNPPVTWTLATNVPANLAGQLTVNVTPQGQQRFYRLGFE